MTILEKIQALELEREGAWFGSRNESKWEYLTEQIEELTDQLDPVDQYIYFSQYKGN